MTDVATARSEIVDLFRDFWLADAASMSIPLVFENVTGSNPPSVGGPNSRPLPWARVSVRNLGGEDETLGPPGVKRYMYEGIVTVEIYTALGDGSQLSDALAQVAKRAFRGNSTTSGVWFFDVGSREIGLDRNLWRADVTARFRYEDR